MVASRYLPGELWPVNPATVRNRDALFCVNERLVTVLDTPVFGRLRGGEGGGDLRGPHPRRLRRPADPRRTVRGAPDVPPAASRWSAATSWAASRWASTVILLFEPGRVVWDDWLVAGRGVRMGQRIGGAP